jgi:hypothetical protein
MAIWRSADGESFERIALAPLAATVGTTLDPMPAGPVGRWDHANSFRVKLASGLLSSMSDMRVLGGANAAAIRNAQGAWEVIQFASAELVGANTYRLSRLLRGQQGSEAAMSSLLESGAPFVLLNEALVPLSRGIGDLGRSLRYRVAPAAHDAGSLQATEMETTIGRTALMPWRPAHLSAKRTEAGIEIAWVRRTRIGGDSWDVAEVPLGEESERYRIEIFDGEERIRSIETDVPRALYPWADELSDFGAAQSSLSIGVAQRSAAAGPGHVRRAIIPTGI